MMSPVNSILIGIAIADMLVITSNIPFVLHSYVIQYDSLGDIFSPFWAWFTLLHAHFTVVAHTISIWLTVILAVWRFLAIK